MKLFCCSHCSNLVYFENVICEKCSNRLGFSPSLNRVLALEDDGERWRAAGDPKAEFRFCANAEHGACNWIVPSSSAETLCAACRHNRAIPDLSIDENLHRWQKLELAKHYLFYGLLKLKLPLETRQQNPEFGLTFDVLSENPEAVGGTGHQDGVITINLAEADDAVREQRRTELGEPYRTLTGHFRHEIGHYYWDRLVREAGRLDCFRDCFGDERQDYSDALAKYYADGPPPDWRDSFVSAYASAHPWEDFAETWAHFLHIVDTLEMAGSLGLRVNPVALDDAAYRAEVKFDPYSAVGIDELIRLWLPIAGAVNSINRCMGQPDLYPFVLTPGVIRKLGFVQRLLQPYSQS
jgi:hypothetical protein